MKVLAVTDEDMRNVEAHVKLGSIEWSERRRLAATSEDLPLLVALSEPDREWDDPDIIENLLENQFTPPQALKNIVDRKLRNDRFDEDKKKLERWTLEAIKHPNADINLLSHVSEIPNWAVRYAVAMRAETPERILEKLSKDEHLAVKAMAARKLGLPFNENLDVGASCVALNQVFDKVRSNIFSNRSDVYALTKQLEMNERYDPFDEVFRKFGEALDALREKLSAEYESLVHRALIPNVNLEKYNFADLMKKFETDHFDAFIIAGELKTLFDQRATVSLNQILNDARSLLPNVSDKSRLASGSPEWAPASKPEHIVKGRRLELRFHRFHIYGGNDDHASVDSEGIPQVAGIDQLSRVILGGADPGTVESTIPEILFRTRTATELFKKISIGGSSPIVAIRIFKSGRFDVAYASEEDARRVAEVLVGSKN